MSDTIVRMPLPPLTATPEDLCDPRTWWPEPDTWAQALANAQPHKPAGVEEAFADLGAPVLDVLVTPMSTRAALLGVATGRAFAHHELRRRIPMPEELEPELPVWEHGTVPVWLDGVLTEPKYFSFFQDAPLPVFHPNHRRKWRAHELLHGAVGWFWRADMSPFEAYVGARLNEILPVVHWYALDEVFRPRCEVHQGKGPQRQLCAACEAAARPFWEHPIQEGDLTRAASLFSQAREHLAMEFDAISEEIATGLTQSTPYKGLDASSDAIGYLKGHWRRMTSWSFGAWVEMFCVQGVDHEETLDVAMTRTAQTSMELIAGEIVCDVERARALRARRAAQDVGYRALLMLEWLDGSSPETARVEARLMPALEALASRCQDVLTGHPDTEALTRAQVRVQEAFLAQGAQWPGRFVEAMGHTGVDGAGDLEQVREGVMQALPRTCEDVSLEDVKAFVSGPQFQEAGWLCDRWARWRAWAGYEDADLVACEAWLVVPGAPDQAAELFGTIPDVREILASGLLRTNATLRRRRFGADVLAVLLPELAGEDRELFAARFRGQVRVGEVTLEVGRALEGEGDEATTEALLLDGVLVFEPRPQVLS